MPFWLFKQEPDCYSTNALAQKHMRSIGTGDKVLFYHTGEEKAIVGIMRVIGDPTPNPENEKQVQVMVGPVKRLPRPVTLAEIKADADFADWELVRISRLSVMPVSAAIWKKIELMAKKK